MYPVPCSGHRCGGKEEHSGYLGGRASKLEDDHVVAPRRCWVSPFLYPASAIKLVMSINDMRSYRSCTGYFSSWLALLWKQFTVVLSGGAPRSTDNHCGTGEGTTSG